MKSVKVEDAVGMVLAHDLTKIVPNEYKGARFRKGHIIEACDIEALKDMGKYHINCLELNDNSIHEDDAAIRIAKAAAGEGIYMEGPVEGKISLKAAHWGLLKVNVDALNCLNSVDSVMMATRHNNTVVEKDSLIAATRIIPLVIENEKIEEVEAVCLKYGKILSVKPLKQLKPQNPPKAGVIVVGTEVYEGRIKDKFGPVIKQKLEDYGCDLEDIIYLPDNAEMIKNAINDLIFKGINLILCCGGMSVDADDVTPLAIRNSADSVITYGSPVLPGAMFMLAYQGSTCIMGIPACAMFHKTTVLDLILPRILAGELVSKKEIQALGHGGLCLECKPCTYPVCPFGK